MVTLPAFLGMTIPFSVTLAIDSSEENHSISELVCLSVSSFTTQCHTGRIHGYAADSIAVIALYHITV